MCALVIRTLDYSVLGELADTFTAERVTAWQRRWLLVIVIVRLEADSTLKNRLYHNINYNNTSL